jgi:hypothetical protein
LPNLGNLPTGLASTNALLSSAQITLTNQVSSAVGNASSQLVGKLTQSVNPAVLGVVATVAAGGGGQLIKNAENLAIVAGTNLVTGALQKGLTTALNSVGTTVGDAVVKDARLVNQWAGSLFGNPGDTLTQEISGLYNNVTQSVTNLVNGNGFINATDLLAKQWGAVEW